MVQSVINLDSNQNSQTCQNDTQSSEIKVDVKVLNNEVSQTSIFTNNVIQHPIDSIEVVNERYNMDYPIIGRFLIFNQENFDKSTPYTEPRYGTEKDANNLKNRMFDLGFEVLSYNDLKKEEIIDVLEDQVSADFRNFACFGCAMLSHGDEHNIWGFDDYLSVNTIINLFDPEHCSSLKGKPKFFFFQSCRGKVMMDGVNIPLAHPISIGLKGCFLSLLSFLGLRTQSNVNGNNFVSLSDLEHDELEGQRKYAVTIDFPDCIVAHSVVFGYYSFRNCDYGAYFIQFLCHALKEFGNKEDLLSILVKVNKNMALKFESKPKKYKQMPCFYNTLTEDLYLSKSI